MHSSMICSILSDSCKKCATLDGVMLLVKRDPTTRNKTTGIAKVTLANLPGVQQKEHKLLKAVQQRKKSNKD